MNIKISIVTITYNSDRTIEETFESILYQRYRPLQYIVIDGDSNDRTLDIIKKYNYRFEKEGIEFSFKSEKDNGISDAFNKGIKYTDGDVIGIINSDDKLAENALEELASKYSSNINVYYGDCIIFNDNSNNEYIAIPKFSKNKSLLNKRMTLFHPSTFISRDTYKKYGVYDTKINLCMDRDLLLRIYKDGGNFLYIKTPLAYYREGGINQINYEKCIQENMEISIKYGMSPLKAQLLKRYYKLHDGIWRIIQKIGLEYVFHKKF